MKIKAFKMNYKKSFYNRVFSNFHEFIKNKLETVKKNLNPNHKYF